MMQNEFTRSYPVVAPKKSPGTRVLLIDCMDRRFAIKRPAARWIEERFGVTPKVATKFGPIVHLSGDWHTHEVKSFTKEIDEAIIESRKNVVVIAAHATCAGNQTSDANQLKQLRKVCAKFRRKYPELRVIGVFVDKVEETLWSVEAKQDSSNQLDRLVKGTYDTLPILGKCVPVLLTCSEEIFSINRPTGRFTYEMLDLPYILAKEAPASQLSHGWDLINSYIESISFAISHANADTIMITAHQGCSAHRDASDEFLLATLREACRKLLAKWPRLRVIGLFTESADQTNWNVSPAFDSHGKLASNRFILRAFLEV